MWRLWAGATALTLLACGPAPARAPEKTAAPPPPPPPRERTAGQLGDEVVPQHYDLTMRIDPSAADFSGTVVIEVRVNRATDTVWLNAKGPDTTARVEQQGQMIAATVDGRGDDARESERVALRLDRPLEPGPARLHLSFRSTYLPDTGVFRRGDLVFTQFQALEARTAFPCFDEPRFKTPWRVTLEIPAALQAYGNAPEVRRATTPDGWLRIEFAETLPLPTYLVAFAVGDFAVHRVEDAPVPMRVISRRDAPRVQEVVAAAGKVLARVESFIGVAHPYPKIDLVLVPEFVWGGMENPGLITLREDDALTGMHPHAERWLVSLLAHEFAHLWFGDLVTPAWWDDLWLSEGFAIWVQREISRAWFGTGEPRLTWVLTNAGRSRMAIETAQDAHHHFDHSSRRDPYSMTGHRVRAAAIIEMLVDWLGRDAFLAAMRRYLANHAHGTATTAALIEALAAIGPSGPGPGVSGVLESYLDRGGAPRVAFELSCADGAGVVSLHQQQLRDHELATAAPWTIPVCIEHERGRVCTVFDQPRGSIPLDRCPAWVVPDPGAAGYFVPVVDRQAIARTANAPGLPAPLRRRLLDQVALAYAVHELGPTDALRAFERLIVDAAGALSAADAVTEIYRRADSSLRPALGAWIRRVVGPHAATAGFGPPPPGVLDRRRLVELVGAEGGDLQLRQRAIAALRADLAATTPSDDLGPAPQLAAQIADQALLDAVFQVARPWRAKLLVALPLAALQARPNLSPRAVASAAMTGLGTSLDDPRDRLSLWGGSPWFSFPVDMVFYQLKEAPGLLCSTDDWKALEAAVDQRGRVADFKVELAAVRRDIERCATERDRDRPGLAAYLGATQLPAP